MHLIFGPHSKLQVLFFGMKGASNYRNTHKDMSHSMIVARTITSEILVETMATKHGFVKMLIYTHL